jgi:ubiquinone/menaquinone biosynthesis C-methylase UbiE
VQLFDAAADEYDAARPSYPASVYDLVEEVAGPLAGKVVGDGGTGTGIVARQLLERGARVVGFDPGPGMLRHARRHFPRPLLVVAEAGAVSLRTGSLELLCFGQSWHWVEQEAGAREAARVLGSGGFWAAWWNHAWADGEPWFERYCTLTAERCPGWSREQRDSDWCADAVRANGDFHDPERHDIAWERRVSVDEWLTDLRSHSHVIALGPSARKAFMADIGAVLRDRFGETMVVPYQTRVWLARRRGNAIRP